MHGEFATLIPHILRYIGPSFSLVFIDPAGWTGFGLRKIEPILRHNPGEVLVNFMFDHINRFLDHPGPGIRATFDDLFGGPGWDSAVHATDRREAAVVELYMDRMRGLGDFAHVTRTRILKPVADRSYFYLVYGTRHVRDLEEFRRIERKVVQEQEQVRLVVKQTQRVARTGQSEMFPAASLRGPTSYEEERQLQLDLAKEDLRSLLRKAQRTKYEAAAAVLLERPYVWNTDVQALIRDLRAAGEVEIEGLQPRKRAPKPGHILVSRSSGGRK